ncbi:MAG: hypothetical protein KDD62_00895, partial [Bdellovibrionales bacterium]|nr:hypothetical protein [Bdellovibrionales bacterium]
TRKPPLVLLGALALLALDVFPPEGIRQIMPLATLGRLVPFLFYLPMTSIWLWVCLFYFLLVSFRAREWTLIAIVYATVMLLPPAEGGLLQHGVFLKSNQNAPLEEFAGRSEKDFNTHQSDFYLTRLLSPSYALLRDMGLWPLDSYLAIKHGKFRTIRKFPHVFSASHNSSHESFVRLADRQLNTRWSPEGGKQNGDEWLHLYLRTPLWLYGIELSSGAFFTDFARGLRLSYLENCTGADAASNGQRNSFEHILTTAEWDGALAYTVDDYPYLQSPSYVKVYFPRPVLAQCLLIEQIGQSKHYDWSIARVRLIRADEID